MQVARRRPPGQQTEKVLVACQVLIYTPRPTAVRNSMLPSSDISNGKWRVFHQGYELVYVPRLGGCRTDTLGGPSFSCSVFCFRANPCKYINDATARLGVMILLGADPLLS